MSEQTPRTHFFDLTPHALRVMCASLGMPSYTAGQVFDWVYAKRQPTFASMTNIAKRHREALREHIHIFDSAIVTHQRATDATQKLLLQWNEHAPALRVIQQDPTRQTECVMIPTASRQTACISSQVGCPVGCAFCASGLGGLDGNLTHGRIVEQAYRLGLIKGVGRITNIVFMGMGEPLANYQRVTDAIRTMNASWGLGIGARRITVSTVGLPGAIRKLVNFEIPVTLALSLHAPNDAIRRSLIPWAQYTTIAELLDACDEYFRKTGREITLEYILLREVNDRPEHARELASIARRLRSNINLIRYNEVRTLPFSRPTTDDVRRFQSILRDAGVNSHIRASRGRDIAAACGQLRHESSSSPTTRRDAAAPASRTSGHAC